MTPPHFSTAVYMDLAPGAAVVRVENVQLPPAATFGRDQAGVWYFIAEVRPAQNATGPPCPERFVSQGFWVGQVLNVITHGFGEKLLGPGFLTPWFQLDAKYSRLAAGQPLEPAVHSFVEVWPSSEGWPEAICFFILGTCWLASGYPDAADDAFRASALEMRVARVRAEEAAGDAVRRAEREWGLDPELTVNGYQVVHLIGHSRGRAVNARVAHLLARRGHRVNQYTALDGYSTDWPHGGGILGDLSITGELAAARALSTVDRQVNYRVQDGLAQVVFDVIEPYLQLLALLRGGPVGWAFSELTKQLIRNALPDWRAPERPGMEDRLITGIGEDKLKRSNHLNIVDLYLGSDARDPGDQYLLDSYFGRALRGGSSISGVGLLGSPDPPDSNPAPELGNEAEVGSDFTDGGFEESGRLFDRLSTARYPAPWDDALKLILAEMQDTNRWLTSFWGATGSVALVQVEGDWVALLRGPGPSAVGQPIVLLPGAEALELDVWVKAAATEETLELLFRTNRIGSWPLPNQTQQYRVQFSLAGAEGAGDMRLRLAGANAATAVQLDNLRIRYAPPRIQLTALLPDGACRLAVTGPPSAVLALDSSEDLRQWELVRHLRCISGPVEYADLRRPATAGRFHRVRLVR